MANFEVKKHNGEVIAKFGKHEQAINFVQNHEDPNIYVDVIEPPPPPPPPPSAFEVWWGESLKTKWWFRYLHAAVLIGLGFSIFLYSNTLPVNLMGIGVMIMGGFFAYELLIIAVVLGFLYLLISGVQSMSVPVAVVVGACIIAFAIYHKKK